MRKKIKLRIEIGHLLKRQQPDKRVENSPKPSMI